MKKAIRKAARKPGFYLLSTWGCIHPELHGPYKDALSRDRTALRRRPKMHPEDALFWVDVSSDGTPKVGAYPGKFFAEA